MSVDVSREQQLIRQRGVLYDQSPNDRETGCRLEAIAEELRQIHQRKIGAPVEPTHWKEWRR